MLSPKMYNFELWPFSLLTEICRNLQVASSEVEVGTSTSEGTSALPAEDIVEEQWHEELRY